MKTIKFLIGWIVIFPVVLGAYLGYLIDIAIERVYRIRRVRRFFDRMEKWAGL